MWLSLALLGVGLLLLVILRKAASVMRMPPVIVTGYSRIFGHIKMLEAGALLGLCEQLSKVGAQIYSLSLGPSWMGLGRIVVLAGPEAVSEFVAHPNSFVRSKSESLKFSRLLSPLCAIALPEGPTWRRHTKLMSKFFFSSNLKRVVEEGAFEKHVNVFLEKLEEGKESFMPLISRLSLDIICEIAFSCSLDIQKSSESELSRAVFEIFNGLKSAVFLDGAKVQASVQHLKALKVLNDFVKSALEKRVAENDEKLWPADFLSLFAAEWKENRFSLDEVVGELVMVICAGYETTSHTLGFLVQHIGDSKDESIQNRLFHEIDDAFRGNEPSYESLTEKLPYLKACLAESQRFDAVALWVSRETIKKVTVCGFELPVGTTVIINNFSMSRNENYFANASTFCPDRFLEEKKNDISTSAHVPFGVGLRSCQGRKLAQLEIHYIMCRILQRFQIVSSGLPFRKSILFTLTPDTNVKFVARPTSSALNSSIDNDSEASLFSSA